jgi:hypothetical protein
VQDRPPPRRRAGHLHESEAQAETGMMQNAKMQNAKMQKADASSAFMHLMAEG